MRVKNPAGVGEPHAPVAAIDQQSLHLALEDADLAAECGLRHTQFLGRGAGVQGFGHGRKVAEVPEFHRGTLHEPPAGAMRRHAAFAAEATATGSPTYPDVARGARERRTLRRAGGTMPNRGSSRWMCATIRSASRSNDATDSGR